MKKLLVLLFFACYLLERRPAIALNSGFTVRMKAPSKYIMVDNKRIDFDIASDIKDLKMLGKKKVKFVGSAEVYYVDGKATPSGEHHYFYVFVNE